MPPWPWPRQGRPVPLHGTSSADAQLVPGSRYTASDREFAAYRGKYQTGDGGSFIVSQQSKQFYTQIHRQAPIEMVGAGPDSFVSHDGRTKIDFRQKRQRRSDGVSVSAVPASTAVAAR